MIISHVIIFDYYNIQNQAFSFDTEFDFKLIDNTISVQPKEFLHNYLNENIHINAVVGANGTGKSTLLNGLVDILSGKSDQDYVLILRENSIFYYNSTREKIKINKIKNSTIKKISREDLYELPLSTILYSNVKSKTTWYLNDKVALLTEKYLTTCSIHECGYQYGDEISEIDAHELNDISRQISYFCNEDVKYLEVTIPDALYFDICKMYDRILSKYEVQDFPDRFEHKIALHKYNTLPEEHKYLGKIYLTFILVFLYEIDNANHDEYLDDESILKINTSLNNDQNGIDYFKNFVKNYSSTKFLSQIFETVPSYTDVGIEKIKDSFLKKEKFIKFFGKNIKSNLILIKDQTILKQFIKLYSESIYKFQYLTLNWEGLSSGENAKLNFYSRIYERIHNKLKTLSNHFRPTKNLVVLIDEGATFFHPEWQRSYIYDIVRYFKDVIIKSSIVENVHVILTSHSPFVISDLTRDQIVYLTKEKQVDSNFNLCKVLEIDSKPLSFAGNISALYRNSFFLEESLIGKYSHMVLDDIMDKLVEKDKNLNIELVEYLLSETSEPILKRHISKMLKKYKAEV